MAFDDVVHSHSQILSGEPVFGDTRVPARSLLDYVAAGESLDSFLEDFPGVRREQAVQFLEQVQTGKLSIPEARLHTDRHD